MEKKDSKIRLMSIDALRGFDMFFIIGGAGLVTMICQAFGCNKDFELIKQMSHVPWEGLRHHDTIFPLFLFLVGVSWPFSLSSQISRGRSSLQIHLKILQRAAILFALGMAYNGVFREFKPQFRIPSVLGFIGLSWAAGAVLFYHLKNAWVRGGLIAVLLCGYWGVLRFVAAPGAPAGCDTYAMEYNIISWLDRTLMADHIFRPLYDPESLFAIVGGVAMALLGMMAGSLLKSEKFQPAQKTLILLAGFVGLLAADALFISVMGDKIVKSLWSPSFVLSAAAYSTFMLAVFYHLVDVWGLKKWAFPFMVIGMNSITIYLMVRFIWFGGITKYFFGGIIKEIGEIDPLWAPVADRTFSILVLWLILYFFYRKKIFLKV